MPVIDKYNVIFDRFNEECIRIFGSRLVGIYLHGSAVMNCFNPKKSDIDLLFVVDGDITYESKLEFLKVVTDLNKKAPEKGLELSIVKKEFCKPFIYPTPYEFHYSNAYKNDVCENPRKYIEKMHGTDRDLAAHFTITYHRGIALYGAEIMDVFEKPSKEYYFDSIWFDIENAVEDIVSYPMYMILNLCRVLAYAEENLILSKKEGGEWGLRNLPQEYHYIVESALDEYENDSVISENPDPLKKYAVYMLDEIRKNTVLVKAEKEIIE